MRKIFLLLILVVAFNCSSNEDYDSIKIEKPTDVVSTDTQKNDLLESELIYKVKVQNPLRMMQHEAAMDL